jgi:hypothetical protein
MTTDYRALCAELLSELQVLRRAVADEIGCPSPEPSVVLRARAALAQPESVVVPVPVPVSERLPGPEDCDGDGRCWFWCKAVKTWDFRSRNRQMVHDTHWLPANSLPTPEPTNG